ncbi:unnamed protein product, partial [Polarella glacialis]
PCCIGPGGALQSIGSDPQTQSFHLGLLGNTEILAVNVAGSSGVVPCGFRPVGRLYGRAVVDGEQQSKCRGLGFSSAVGPLQQRSGCGDEIARPHTARSLLRRGHVEFKGLLHATHSVGRRALADSLMQVARYRFGLLVVGTGVEIRVFKCILLM